MMKMQYQFLQMWRLVQLWEGHGYKRLRLGHVPLLSLVMVNLPLYIIFVQAKPCRWGHSSNFLRSSVPRKGRYPTSGKPRGSGGNGGITFLDFLDAHRNQINTANIETKAVTITLESSSFSSLPPHHHDHMVETVLNIARLCE